MFSKFGLYSTYCQQLYYRSNLGNDSIYLIDSHSKDKNGNLSSSGTAILLKFDTLYSQENYVRSVYYNFRLTLYFQVQLINVHCIIIAKDAIKYELVSKEGDRFSSQKRKYHDNPKEKKRSS